MSDFDQNPPVLSYSQDNRNTFLEILSHPTIWNLFSLSLVILGSLIRIYAARLPLADGLLYLLGWALTYFGLIPNLIYLCKIGYQKIRHIPRTKVHFVLRTGPILIVLIAYSILYLRLPRQLYFMLNRSSMDRWIASVQSSGTQLNLNSLATIGSYDCWMFEPIPGGYRFHVMGSGFFRGGGGFVYSPDVAPSQSDSPQEEIYTHAGGNWYFYEFYKP